MECQDEWIDLTKDNDAKIYKKIIRSGEIIYDVTIKKNDEDLRPKNGDRVKVKLIGKIETDQSVFLNGEFEFNLFTGENIKGLDIVISSMIQKELCEAIISSDYVVDDLFNEDQLKIPRNQQLIYTIELLDWENEYLSRKNDGGVLRKVLQKGIGYETPVINSMVTINLIGYYQTRDQNNCIILNKFDERTNFKFKLSEGSEVGLVRGAEFAIYKMKINEKNRVYVLKKYSTHFDYDLNQLNAKLNCKLPDNYEKLIYEIELKSFEIKKQIWQLSIKERFKLCETEKRRGAEFFKQNKLHLSLKCYSEILQAIGPPKSQLDLTQEEEKSKTEFMINSYNNMTLCFLKLKMPKEALKYADWALVIDANNLKALYRKGLANYDRNDFKQAIELFNRCIELDPNNKAARNQINLCQQQIEKYANKEKQIFSKLFEALANDKEVQSMDF